MVNRRTLIATALAAATGACSSPPAAAAGQLVQVQLVERSGGGVLNEYLHRGNTWVAGRPGERYAVRLSNRTGARVLVVLSVDGINAVSGQTAATSQTGYVLSPWQTADITGWRKSDAEAAAFYFTALPDSFAARTDRPQNVGVIGVAAFREREPQPRPVPFEPAPYSSKLRDGGARQSSARAANDSASAGKAGEGAVAPAAAAAPARTERLGTGHGEREYSPISRTAFERATVQPAEVVQIRYDSHANLVAGGIIHAPRYAVPEPFPGYVPDPR